MTASMYSRILAVPACLALAAVVGCAGMGLPKGITQNDTAARHKARTEEAVRQFEQKRDLAEFEAAKARWAQQGDAEGCRGALEKLLARNPKHAEAKQLLAELPPKAETADAKPDVVNLSGPPEDFDAVPAGYAEPSDRADSTDSSAQSDGPRQALSAAAAALRANEPKRAVELLVPAAKAYPKSAAIHRMLGAAHYRMGDYKSSQLALRQALSLDKSSALSYLLMGYALAKLGQPESAEGYFRQARVLDPKLSALR